MDYYKVLEISNAASQDDIRKSFRYLALKYHPDRNKNSEESKQKFMQIVEAYKVLSDEQARKNYDVGATTITNTNDINKYHYAHYCSYKYNPIRRCTLSSNSEMHSYADIKRRYIENQIYDAHVSTISLSVV
jgi:curved DNA-binding protein CbpA